MMELEDKTYGSASETGQRIAPEPEDISAFIKDLPRCRRIECTQYMEKRALPNP